MGQRDGGRAEPEMVSAAGLKARGWTAGLIRKHLNEPDKLVANPHYSSAGAPMRLYKLSRVERAENGRAMDLLADAAAKRNARRAAAEKAVKTKVEQLVDEIDVIDIQVCIRPWNVVAAAMRSAVTDDGYDRQMMGESTMLSNVAWF